MFLTCWLGGFLWLTQYPGQKEPLAGKKTLLNASAEARCACLAFSGFSARLQICTSVAAELSHHILWCAEMQHCTVNLSCDLFQWCHNCRGDCTRFTGQKSGCWLLQDDGLCRESCLLAVSFCCFIALRTTKTNTFHVLLLLEAQASEAFLCSLKQCLLRAQVLKLMLFVYGRSVFL